MIGPLNIHKQKYLLAFIGGCVAIFLIIDTLHTIDESIDRENRNEDVFIAKMTLMKTDGRYVNVRDLKMDLNYAVEVERSITGYRLSLADEVISSFPEDPTLFPDLNKISHPDEIEVYDNETVAHAKITLAQDTYDLRAIQVRYPRWEIVKLVLADRKKPIAALLASLVLLFGFLHRRSRMAISKLSKAIRTTTSSLFTLNLSESAEEEAILNFIKAHIEKAEELAFVTAFAEKNMLTAKSWALRRKTSGGSLPTTHVQFDMNSYTGLMNSLTKPQQHLFRVIWLEWAMEVIARYNFFIHAENGDEFLVFIDGEESPNHQHMGIHLIRTVFEESKHLENRLLQNLGRDIATTFKFSIDSEYGEHVIAANGMHSLISGSLINTSRYLSNISERKHSSFIFHERDASVYGPLVKGMEKKMLESKNSDNRDYGDGYIAREVLGLPIKDLASLKDLSCYRSIKDVCQFLGWIGKHGATDVSTSLKTIQHLRSFPYKMDLEEIFGAYTSSLKKTAESGDVKVLTALISLAAHIFSGSQYQLDVSMIISSLKYGKDERLRADITSTVRTLTLMPVNVSEFQKADSSRTSGDALLKYVEDHELTEGVSKTLHKWYASDNKVDRQRALYACYKILKFYKQSRYPIYKANDEFPALKEMLLKHRDSPDGDLKKWADVYLKEVA